MPSVSVNGSQIHYEERGEGLPVVLVHGFPLDGRIFDDQLAAVSGRRRVIVPDLPGFGRSSAGGDFTCSSLADDLHEFLNRVDALPCVLGGLSMGGYVALPFARKYLQDLHGLILMDTRAEADTPDGKVGRQKMLESLESGGTQAVAEQMFPRLIAQATQHQRPEVARKLGEIIRSQRPETIRRAIVAMRDREDHAGALKSIDAPTLIIVGEHDVITPPELARQMHAALPTSWMVTIENSGHLPTMEQPERTNAAIAAFLDELEAS